MEEIVKNYYNLEGIFTKISEDLYLIYSNDTYYYFMKCLRNEEELNDIGKICLELKNIGIRLDEIILNGEKRVVTNNFVLVKINFFLDSDTSLKEMLRYNEKLVVSKGVVNNWASLWEQKIDYLEYQIGELGQDKVELITSFSYYIGLAECALLVLKNVERKYNKDTKLVLSRIRINYPNYDKDYFNPLNFIFDNRMRDIAEYIKSMFFQKEDVWPSIYEIFKKPYTVYEYNIFYARMLFPTYYFDLFEDIILDNRNGKEIFTITNLLDDYQDFLSDLYFYLSKFAPLERVPWITKKSN